MRAQIEMVIYIALSIVIFFISMKCFSSDYKEFKGIEYVRNYDGDTVTVNIPNVHSIIGEEVPIRIDGIDTAEIRGKRDCEEAYGRMVKDFVAKELKSASVIVLNPTARGKYFRIVGDLIYDKKSLKTVLLEKGHAVKYGTEKDWCKEEL